MFSESKFTKSRIDCVHPAYWHAPDGQGTEEEISILLGAMVRALQPETVLETGTHNGDSAELIGKALKANGHGVLFTIEIDSEKVNRAKKRLKTLPVKVIQADSLTYTPLKTIDFLWIDGMTTSERHREWLHLKSFLSPSGVVMFHDTGPHRVFRQNLEGDEELAIIHLPTPRGVSIGRLRSIPAKIPGPPGSQKSNSY